MISPPNKTPFVGLRPFEIADHRWFYGRDQEIAALLSKLCSHRFTAVVGAPGCGKSSLVRCGVLASLVKDGWKAIIVRPGSTPITKLALALANTAGGHTENLLEMCTYWHDTTLCQSTLTLNKIAHRTTSDDQRLLLVIDQFEELFCYDERIQEIEKAAMEEERHNFIELLLTAVFQDKNPLHVIITLRSGYTKNCIAYSGLNEVVKAYQYPVLLPTQDQLKEIIRKPVIAAGGRIDEILVQRLLLDATGQTHPLPWLQHTIQQLWKAAQGKPHWLREQDYHTKSGKPDTISIRPERTASGFKQTFTEDSMVLKQITTTSTRLDKKGQVSRQMPKHIARPDLVTEAVDCKKKTNDAWSMAVNQHNNEEMSIIQLGGQDNPEIDMNHEVLIRSWQCSDKKNPQFCTDWQVRRQKNRNRWWNLAYHNKTHPFTMQNLIKGNVLSLTILGAMTLVASISVFFAQAYHHEKTRQETESLKQLRAQARATAEYAQGLIDMGHTRRGALIALNATPKNRRSNDPNYADEIGAALANALTRPIEIMRRYHRSLIYSVTYSPDGSLIASSGTDNALHLWDANTGKLINKPMLGHDGPINSIAFSPDGDRIISGSWDNSLRLWDINTGKTIGEPLHGHTSYVISVAFSPDGNRIVSGSTDKILRIWDANSGKAIGKPLIGHSSFVYSVAYSPDGSRIVSGSSDKMVRLWDANTGVSIGKPLTGHKDTVYSVAFSPDGSRIVSGSEDKMLRLWDANTGAPIGGPMRGHDGPVNSVAFSPDGSRIVSGGSDKALRIWDIRIFFEPLETLVAKAEKLCPLSLIERQQFHLVGPVVDSMASPLMLTQRRACGK